MSTTFDQSEMFRDLVTPFLIIVDYIFDFVIHRPNQTYCRCEIEHYRSN